MRSTSAHYLFRLKGGTENEKERKLRIAREKLQKFQKKKGRLPAEESTSGSLAPKSDEIIQSFSIETIKDAVNAVNEIADQQLSVDNVQESNEEINAAVINDAFFGSSNAQNESTVNNNKVSNGSEGKYSPKITSSHISQSPKNFDVNEININNHEAHTLITSDPPESASNNNDVTTLTKSQPIAQHSLSNPLSGTNNYYISDSHFAPEALRNNVEALILGNSLDPQPSATNVFQFIPGLKNNHIGESPDLSINSKQFIPAINQNNHIATASPLPNDHQFIPEDDQFNNHEHDFATSVTLLHFNTILNQNDYQSHYIPTSHGINSQNDYQNQYIPTSDEQHFHSGINTQNNYQNQYISTSEEHRLHSGTNSQNHDPNSANEDYNTNANQFYPIVNQNYDQSQYIPTSDEQNFQEEYIICSRNDASSNNDPSRYHDFQANNDSSRHQDEQCVFPEIDNNQLTVKNAQQYNNALSDEQFYQLKNLNMSLQEENLKLKSTLHALQDHITKLTDDLGLKNDEIKQLADKVNDFQFHAKNNEEALNSQISQLKMFKQNNDNEEYLELQKIRESLNFESNKLKKEKEAFKKEIEAKEDELKLKTDNVDKIKYELDKQSTELEESKRILELGKNQLQEAIKEHAEKVAVDESIVQDWQAYFSGIDLISKI